MGSVPYHPIYLFGRVQGGGTPKADAKNWNGSLPFITPTELAGLDGAAVSASERTVTEIGATQSSVIEAGVLVSCRAPIGSIGTTTTKVTFNQGCKGISIPDPVQAKYVAYALIAARPELENRGNGTTFSEISSNSLGQVRIPAPPLPTQRAIADYLDRETAEIDRMRADLDEIERLLEERKQTTVTESFADLEGDTNGRKASLNSVAELISSNVDKKSREGEKPVRLVNYTDVYYGDTLTADEPYMEATATAEQIQRVGVKDGDIIFTKDSETADDIGIPALISKPDPDMVCGYHLTIARPRSSRVYPRFLYWAFMSGQTKSYWEQSANGVTRYSIGYTATARLRFPLPPLAEQRRIADDIDRETAEIDSMLEDITKLRDLLAERRAAVISAAVTGQIDIPVSPTSKDEAHA